MESRLQVRSPDPKEGGAPRPGGLLRHARFLGVGSQAPLVRVLPCAERLGRVRAPAAAAAGETASGGFPEFVLSRPGGREPGSSLSPVPSCACAGPRSSGRSCPAITVLVQ